MSVRVAHAKTQAAQRAVLQRVFGEEVERVLGHVEGPLADEAGVVRRHPRVDVAVGRDEVPTLERAGRGVEVQAVVLESLP